MYLATMHVTLDLEPEVAATDRERVLRALRDRLKHAFGSRVTVRTDDDAALVVAFFDDNHARLLSRCSDIYDKIEDASEARILIDTKQVFAWYEGRFEETKDALEDSDGGGRFSRHDHRSPHDRKGGSANSPGSSSPQNQKTIRYENEDDAFAFEGEKREDMRPIPSRFSRRSLRLPTRK